VVAPDERVLGFCASGTVWVSNFRSTSSFEKWAAAGLSVVALERVPRSTRAQGIDTLSSQATVVGYKAVLLAASAAPRLLPMLTTAAGTLVPAKTLVLGAGVAGLQAIATAKRLGSQVFAFDVRPQVREQVESLGAKFIEAAPVPGTGQSSQGYAQALDDEQQRRVLEAVGRAIVDMDLVITTALVPGKAAPRLVTADMVLRMRKGSVIVDCAAEQGGNCELTRPNETIDVAGVTVLGPLNLPSTVPLHASQMFSKNIENLLSMLATDNALHLNVDDDVVGPMLAVHAGRVRHS
jgi:NAD(P) transhydrogenase subunit alpha